MTRFKGYTLCFKLLGLLMTSWTGKGSTVGVADAAPFLSLRCLHLAKLGSILKTFGELLFLKRVKGRFSEAVGICIWTLGRNDLLFRAKRVCVLPSSGRGSRSTEVVFS